MFSNWHNVTKTYQGDMVWTGDAGAGKGCAPPADPPDGDSLPMTPIDIARVQAYLRKLFSNNLIRIVPPARAGLSVEFAVGDEVLGTVYKDVEDGEISYSVTLTILDEDLPDVQAGPAPTSRRR
jgi:Protein of unknown function (DUF3126)